MSRTVIHLPAVALRGMTILPGMVAHFDISRDRSISCHRRGDGWRPENIPDYTSRMLP